MSTCEVCGFEAKSAAGLSAHVRARHPEEQLGSVTAEVARLVDGKSGPLAAAAVRVAGLLDDPGLSARDAAGLSRELRQLVDSLSNDGQEARSGLDELRARRAARRSAS